MAKVYIILCYVIVSCAPVRVDIPVHERSTDTIVNTVFLTDSFVYCPNNVTRSFLDTLQSFVGIEEATGNNDGVEIREMLNVCGLGEGNPWCAAQIALALVKNGKTPPDKCAWSPSFFPDHKVNWRKGQSGLIPEGSVFGLWFESKKRVAHVGVIVKDTGRGWVITYEGNTNADGSRDGNMSATRMRKKSQIYVCSDWVR